MAPRDSHNAVVQRLRAIDQNWIEQGVDPWDLMGRVGAALARWVQETGQAHLSGSRPHVLILVGPGNNGGDGLACYQELSTLEPNWTVELAYERLPPSPEAKRFAAGIPASVALDSKLRPDLVVDCLLGSGARGSPRGFVAQALSWLRACTPKPWVLACDQPSGDWGRPPEACLELVRRKGTWTDATAVRVEDLGIPDAFLESVGVGDAREVLHPVELDTHKGKLGHVLLVGGFQFPGAILLAARAAFRVGVDLVTIVTSKEQAPTILAALPSAMVRDTLPESFERYDAILWGPGTGRGEGSGPSVHAIGKRLAESGVPVLVDADPLRSTELPLVPGWILTPNRSERKDLESRAPAKELQDLVLVAKGVVDEVHHQGRTLRVAWGHPGLSKGGTGDILAGTITGLVAIAHRTGTLDIGLDRIAAVACYLEGGADERLGQRLGQGFLVEELLEELAVVVKIIRDGGSLRALRVAPPGSESSQS